MTDFVIEEPRSLEEAVEMLSTSDENVRPIAGGTGLVLLLRYGFFEPTRLISLRRLPSDLAAIRTGDDGSLTIGALATARDLERSAALAQHAPMMVEALARLSSVRVRNVATVGGCLAHGHPQMDLPPVAIAMDARVRARSAEGERWIAAEDLFRGYYETALSGHELVTEMCIPPRGAARGRYQKVTARTFEDWPIVGIAARCECDGDRIADARVAVGAVGDHAQRLPSAEDALRGERRTECVLRHAAEVAADSVECHGDPTASEEYRRALIRVHLLRVLRELTEPTE